MRLIVPMCPCYLLTKHAEYARIESAFRMNGNLHISYHGKKRTTDADGKVHYQNAVVDEVVKVADVVTMRAYTN